MRGLSKRFLDAMRQGLENGRKKGRVGWDRYWGSGTYFPYSPIRHLKDRMNQEMEELAIAIHNKNPNEILKECADVANFAMMIADITKDWKNDE